MSSGSTHSLESHGKKEAPRSRTPSASSRSSHTLTSAASRSSLDMNGSRGTRSRRSSQSSFSSQTSHYDTDTPRSASPSSSNGTPVVDLPRGVPREQTPAVRLPDDAPRKTRDHFFDQAVSERDYAGALDSLAQSSARDDDFRSQTDASDVAHMRFDAAGDNVNFMDGFKVRIVHLHSRRTSGHSFSLFVQCTCDCNVICYVSVGGVGGGEDLTE